jgi:hypothetical protein
MYLVISFLYFNSYMFQSFDHHQTIVQNLTVRECKTRHARECSPSLSLSAITARTETRTNNRRVRAGKTPSKNQH